MKRILITTIILQAALAMAGCASAFKTASVGDDLYEIHNKTEIAKRQAAEAELAKAQAEARRAQWEAKIAEAQAAAAANNASATTYGTAQQVNPYDAVLADDYESAYARRLYGFSSPSYRMPSSYYALRYSDAFSYATAYDPAFYNVMVSGDQVWVEPKYITSMFGTWGATVAVPTYSWYYGWSSPHISAWWGYPRYSWYDWGWGYDSYWGFAWGYGYPYYHHHYHYHPSPSYPHPGGGGRPYWGGNVVHRPHNGGGSYRGHGSTIGGGTRGDSGSGYYNGTVRRGSGSTVGSGVYRGNNSGQYRGNGNSGVYRGNSNSGQYRGTGSTRSDNDSWNSRSESNSFRSNSGSSYHSNSSSGSYGSGYSGGGNVSGGSHGGGQRRR